MRSWRFFVFRKVRDTAARKLNRSRNKTVGERAGGEGKNLMPFPLAPSPVVFCLSCGYISYFTKHNSKSTPKNRQLRGLTETVIISQIPFILLNTTLMPVNTALSIFLGMSEATEHLERLSEYNFHLPEDLAIRHLTKISDAFGES